MELSVLPGRPNPSEEDSTLGEVATPRLESTTLPIRDNKPLEDDAIYFDTDSESSSDYVLKGPADAIAQRPRARSKRAAAVQTRSMITIKSLDSNHRRLKRNAILSWGFVLQKVRPPKVRVAKELPAEKLPAEKRRPKQMRQRYNPQIFLAEYAEEFHVAQPPILARGLIVRAESRVTSATYAHNIYNSLQSEKEFIVWTDASSGQDTRSPAATAVTFRQDPRSPNWADSVSLVWGYATIDEVELVAIQQGLQIALQQYPQTAGQEVVKLFTDSQAALKWIQEGRPTVRRLRRSAEIQSVLSSLTTMIHQLIAMECRVELHWVKGHFGVYGNNRADKWAGAAREMFIGRAKASAEGKLEIQELEIAKLLGQTKDARSSWIIPRGRRKIDCADMAYQQQYGQAQSTPVTSQDAG